MDPVSRGFSVASDIVAQGEKTVGSATVQLTATSTPCQYVWIGAPCANHTKGSANTGNILIGKESAGNASGGVCLANDNYTGVVLLVRNANLIYLTGFNAGDVVEYQVYG